MSMYSSSAKKDLSNHCLIDMLNFDTQELGTVLTMSTGPPA